MKASVVDLRYKMKQVLRALDRNESVTVMYHGKKKAVMVPVGSETVAEICSHPFFGMYREDVREVDAVMSELRGGRY